MRRVALSYKIPMFYRDGLGADLGHAASTWGAARRIGEHVVDHLRELGRQTVDRIGDELLERGQLTPRRTQIASECLAALDQGFEVLVAQARRLSRPGDVATGRK